MHPPTAEASGKSDTPRSNTTHNGLSALRQLKVLWLWTKCCCYSDCVCVCACVSPGEVRKRNTHLLSCCSFTHRHVPMLSFMLLGVSADGRHTPSCKFHFFLFLICDTEPQTVNHRDRLAREHKPQTCRLSLIYSNQSNQKLWRFTGRLIRVNPVQRRQLSSFIQISSKSL